MTLIKSGWRLRYACATRRHSPQNENRQLAITLLLIAVVLAGSLMTTGCLNPNRPHALGNCVDGLYSNFRERVWARRAFNLEYGHLPRKFREHFRRGFVEGYCNVCNGGDGYVPAMPPRDYWGYEYQSSDGAQCVSAWFDGYPKGVAAARSANAGKNADMYISNMIERAVQQEKDGVRLASQVEVVRSTKPNSEGTPTTVPGAQSAEPPVPVSSRQEKKSESSVELNSPAATVAPLVPLKPSGPSMIVGQGELKAD